MPYKRSAILWRDFYHLGRSLKVFLQARIRVYKLTQGHNKDSELEIHLRQQRMPYFSLFCKMSSVV
jgi:hypothetical protein